MQSHIYIAIYVAVKPYNTSIPPYFTNYYIIMLLLSSLLKF